ncbi:hypothetical protein EC843_101707 [Buttiauxella sp. JUb87]|uniref:hypothetical protein n=1 Tax=Buttiauxella sp. JUb87 TaxID=2485129 RepID=UPI0010611712|nr:hypothetical protein [Buttiauxella sp. JUb87]TDN54656.1 hypothetical protein EC843_101707 [Buttiauxella sp. JUb87]
MTTSKVKTGIDAAFSRPLRPVYIVMRHGFRKRCLSRSAALNNLANYMTSHAFRLARVDTHYPDTPVIRDGMTVHQLGHFTEEYVDAHRRCVRRLRRLLARKREIQQWQEKHDALTDRYRDFMKTKPF